MCNCDSDYPKLQNLIHRKARKSHKCDECGSVINLGETYRIDRGLTDHWYLSKTCDRCEKLLLWAQGNIKDYCFPLGDLHTCFGDLDIISWDDENEIPWDMPPEIEYIEGYFRLKVAV